MPKKAELPQQARPWQQRSLQFFEELPKRVFTRKDLIETLNRNRTTLDAPLSLSGTRFIAFLLEFGRLRKVEINPVPRVRSELPEYKGFLRYTWGDASPLEAALSLRRGSYLTHATAVFLYGLTNQIPRTVYANKEQTPKPSGSGLTQEGMDRAFSNNPRTSNYVFEYNDYRLVLLSGKNTGRLEVIARNGLQNEVLEVTGLERTLIDITVRPAYSGGVFEVLEAFRAAKDRLSVGTLIATLRKLDFVYPYHQAIGFYMQRAGYEERLLSRVRALGLHYDFYLTNKMPSKLYDSAWRLYYPKGF